MNIRTPEFEPKIFTKSWEAENDLAQVETQEQIFSDWLREHLANIGLDNDELEAFLTDASTGFREALINAISYGNLGWAKKPGVDYETGQRQKEIAELASNSPDLSAIKAKINLEFDAEKLTVKIWDNNQQPLNFEQVEDPTAENRLLLETGRGLLLIRHYYQEVNFFPKEKGKEIVMVKYLNPDLQV